MLFPRVAGARLLSCVRSSRCCPRPLMSYNKTQVAHLNMNIRSRIEWASLWGVIATHFGTVGSISGSTSVAMYTVDCLRQLALKFLDKVFSLPSTCSCLKAFPVGGGGGGGYVPLGLNIRFALFVCSRFCFWCPSYVCDVCFLELLVYSAILFVGGHTTLQKRPSALAMMPCYTR